MKNLDFKIVGISIDVDKLFASSVSIIWQLLISTLVFYLVNHFGHKFIGRYLDKHSDKLTLSKRSQTISALVNSLFRYTVIFFYAYSVLTILGIPVGTLIASAGIFSLAIGLGAQGFMSDLVNGFFILSEGQFDVGDNIEIGTETGTVTQLGLRTTQIVTTDGTLIYIPNRQISIVRNLTHGGIGLNLDLNLDADTDLKQLSSLLDQADEKLLDWHEKLVSGPSQIGVISQQGQTITYRVHFQVKPGFEGKVRQAYWQGYLQLLKEKQVKFGQEPVIINSKKA
ncbi:mechanosensitive ion channel protein MscS [Lactobacillus nasalidis]|uniref:Mechanosensitive ion channel protein MscS n=1 Tax=Lactobacillus nasalidis TaxID=2797258 RepID=A0ABQ3WAL0_9LACO|nr:mechanosensitive ion channel domain-containing protein [Lactobacillus nasalidis]GHV97101.1 mechanosensitive ion channel protein MscS [Lactobacillus nasalidis]GHV99308.1 mechanosensitive ion channel protein MscS [Lactobacillus nasalidis]GHW01907.1 mechanosensitive ion channel protein MscS [Lactobacillus nasalidis]